MDAKGASADSNTTEYLKTSEMTTTVVALYKAVLYYEVMRQLRLNPFRSLSFYQLFGVNNAGGIHSRRSSSNDSSRNSSSGSRRSIYRRLDGSNFSSSFGLPIDLFCKKKVRLKTFMIK